MILKVRSASTSLDSATTVNRASIVAVTVLSGPVAITHNDPVANTVVGSIVLPAGFHTLEKKPDDTLVANTAAAAVATSISFR